jgi:hypothetical protein
MSINTYFEEVLKRTLGPGFYYEVKDLDPENTLLAIRSMIVRALKTPRAVVSYEAHSVMYPGKYPPPYNPSNEEGRNEKQSIELLRQWIIALEICFTDTEIGKRVEHALALLEDLFKEYNFILLKGRHLETYRGLFHYVVESVPFLESKEQEKALARIIIAVQEWHPSWTTVVPTEYAGYQIIQDIIRVDCPNRWETPFILKFLKAMGDFARKEKMDKGPYFKELTLLLLTGIVRQTDLSTVLRWSSFIHDTHQPATPASVEAILTEET